MIIIDSFQQLGKVWSTRIGWLTGDKIQTEPPLNRQQQPKVFSTTLDLYSFQAIASIAKESGDTLCSSKVSGTARGGACPGRFHPDGVAQLKTLRVAIECVFKIMGPSVQGRFKDPRPPRPCAREAHRDTRYTEDQFVLLGLDDALWLRGRPSPRAKETRRLPRLLGRCREVIGEILGDFLIFLLQKKVPKMFKQS